MQHVLQVTAKDGSYKEVDGIALYDNEAAIVETKTTLRPGDVSQLDAVIDFIK